VVDVGAAPPHIYARPALRAKLASVLQETSRPNRFVITEGWKGQAAFEVHDRGTAKSDFESALGLTRNSPAGRHMPQPFANAAARAAPAGGGLYMPGGPISTTSACTELSDRRIDDRDRGGPCGGSSPSSRARRRSSISG
jgi:hypothetical protein